MRRLFRCWRLRHETGLSEVEVGLRLYGFYSRGKVVVVDDGVPEAMFRRMKPAWRRR